MSPGPEARGGVPGIWQVCGRHPQHRASERPGRRVGPPVACALENRDSLFFACVPEPVLPRLGGLAATSPSPSCWASRVWLPRPHSQRLHPEALGAVE